MQELTTTNELTPITYQADRNPALVYLARLAETGRRTQRNSLRFIANLVQPGVAYDAFPWPLLRYQHVMAIRAHVATLPAAATANRHLAALRGVLKEAWRLGYMTAEDYQRAIDFKLIRGTTANAGEKGRHLKQGELAALLGACDDGSLIGVRDAALIAVCYMAGLRRTELADLLMDDWNPDDDECTLTIRRGKGNKERVIPLGDEGCEALNAWLDVRGPWPGALFTVVRKGDHLTLDSLTAQSVYDILAKRAEQAKVKRFSPHDLRRTFAGDLLDAGADLATVQKLMGHSNANTTASYDRRDAKAKRTAVNKLHLPYSPKRRQGERRK